MLIVDDGSTDGTADILRDGNWPDEVRVIYHERNRGKGAAIRTALAEARGAYTTIMDADLEYEPADIPALLGPLRPGDAQAVFGTRGFQSHSAYSFWYVIGNRSVTFAANLLYNSWVSDMMTGQKAMSTELFRSLELRAARICDRGRDHRAAAAPRRSHLRGADHATPPAAARRARS